MKLLRCAIASRVLQILYVICGIALVGACFVRFFSGAGWSGFAVSGACAVIAGVMSWRAIK